MAVTVWIVDDDEFGLRGEINITTESLAVSKRSVGSNC